MRASSCRPASLFLALALGCAGCEEARPPAAPPPPPAAPQPPASCVYFKDLRPFLPKELAGFTVLKDEGSTGKYGEVVMSEAERVFTRADRRVAVRIVDTPLSGKLGHSIREAAEEAGERDDDNAAPVRLKETVGYVRYDPSEEKAEANLLVGGRYVVAVTGEGFQGAEEVRRIAGTLDLAGLSKLR